MITKQKMEGYFAAREALLECFGTSYPEYIEDNSESEWTDEIGDFEYLIDGEVYGYDSCELMGTSEDYNLYAVSDNGKEFYAIFKISNRVTDEDEIKEKFDW